MTVTSKTPGVYPIAEDPCARAVMIETTGLGGSIAPFSGFTVTFGSSNANLVGQYALNYAWAIRESPTVVQDSFAFAAEI